MGSAVAWGRCWVTLTRRKNTQLEKRTVEDDLSILFRGVRTLIAVNERNSRTHFHRLGWRLVFQYLSLAALVLVLPFCCVVQDKPPETAAVVRHIRRLSLSGAERWDGNRKLLLEQTVSLFWNHAAEIGNQFPNPITNLANCSRKRVSPPAIMETAF